MHKAARLTAFAYGRQDDLGEGLVSVKCKTGFAGARTRMVVHAVLRMAAIQYRSKIRYGSQWLCGGGSTDAVPVADPEAHGGTCDRCMEMLAHGVTPGPGAYVYRCMDAAEQLLYVGSTGGDVAGRLASHEKNASWWPSVNCVRVERFNTELAARGAEFRAIRIEAPLYNIHGKPRSAA